VLLDQNMIEAHHSLYPQLVPKGTKLLLGGYFALLRAEFAKAYVARERHVHKNGLREVVLFMGSTDAENLTLKLAAFLRQHFDAAQIVVLVGHLNIHRSAIEKWCREQGVRFEVGLEDVAYLLQSCRLFIGACGMTAVEAQALGIPSLLISLSPIQLAVAQWFAARQRAVTFELNDCGDADAFSKALKKAVDLDLDVSSERPLSVDGALHVVDALMDFSHE